MERPSFREFWAKSREEVGAIEVRLVSEVGDAWKSLHEVLTSVAERFRAEGFPQLERGSRSDLEGFLPSVGERFLFDIAGALAAIRPLEKAIQSIERQYLDAQDLLGRLPESLSASGEEIALAIAPYGVPALYLRLLRFHKKPREIALRQVMARHLMRRSATRLRLDGSYSLLLCQVLLHVVQPWQNFRRAAFATISGATAGAGRFEEQRRRWFARTDRFVNDADAILAKYEGWKNGSEQALVRSMATTIFRRRRAPERDQLRERGLRYWSRQRRAVTALLKLEVDLAQLAQDADGLSSEFLSSVDNEHLALVDELDSVIGWLSECQAQGGPAGAFPPAAAIVAAAEERATEWMRGIEALAARRLAPRIETSDPHDPLPPRRSPWRILRPEQVFQETLRQHGQRSVLDGFREPVSIHQAVLREIERAREVVNYTLEVARTDPKSGRQIAAEGMANALSLTSYQRRVLADPHPIVERRLVEAIVATLQATYTRLEQSRLGFMTTLAQETVSDAAREAASLLARTITSAGHRLGHDMARAYHRILLAIGWETPPVAISSPVVTRGYLEDILNLNASHCELPMIYRRLFRLAPVEEPRFLVGRHAEMGALAQAKSLWESERAVSVIIVGARGSGKTSLLNCAVAGLLHESPIVRSQFGERITDAAGMRQFLAAVLEAGDPAELVASLARQRGIVILEELERTFLRRIHGFEGLREFLRIISATAPGVMWIVSMNQHAYHYLDAAVDLGKCFSHRINAMAVPPEDLKAAILLRHNLSGLRLEYPPPPPSSQHLGFVGDVFGLRRQVEEVFFDSLYRHSEGVFRTAFGLWQEHVERVEGGVVFLRNPTEPAYETLISGLVLDDALCLQAILQHGSLTEQEHAAVFGCGLDDSRSRIERLLSFEVLEREQQSPGFRVRPEAQRVVHVVLHRLNLI